MKKNDLLTFILYCLGCMLPPLMLIYHFDILNSGFAAFLLLLIITVGIYFLWNYVKYVWIRWAILVGGVFLVLLNQSILIDALMYVYNEVVETYGIYTGLNFQTFNVYFSVNQIQNEVLILLLLLQIFVSEIMCLLFNGKKTSLIFTVTLIFVSPSLIFQIQLNWFLMILQFAFWFMLFIVLNDKKILIDWKARGRQLLIVSLSVCLVSGGFMKVLSESRFKAMAYKPFAIDFLLDQVNSLITFFSTLQFDDDRLDLNLAGNRFYTGVQHLEVRRNRREDLYLKYYSGAIYEDNSWKALEEEAYSELSESEFERSYEWIVKYDVSSVDTEDITVTDLRSGNVYAPIPYYLRSIDADYTMNRDIFIKLQNKNETAVYQVWNPKTVTFNRKYGGYASFVDEYYLDVPNDVQILFKDKMDLSQERLSIDEATSRILSVLSEYRYTLAPGSIPDGKDFLEYFLIESQRGYCVHFATAATLMFRYYGIPARYAEGYHVDASSFDSYMNAKVVDSDAHAWVEVFDDTYGWVPIEVTVGRMNHSTSNETPDEPSSSQNERPNDTPNNPSSDPSGNQPDDPSDDPIEDNPPANTNQIYLHIIGVILAIVVLSLLYMLYRILYRRLLNKKLTQTNRQQAVFEIYRYLCHIEKYQKVINEKILSLFEKNRFSKEGLDEKEYEILLDFARQSSFEVYCSLPWQKKILYKYVKCLI